MKRFLLSTLLIAALGPLKANALDANEVFARWQPHQSAARTPYDDEYHSWCGEEYANLGEHRFTKQLLAANLAASGHFEEAIKEYTELIQGYPDGFEYLRERAVAYEQIGLLDLALADIKSAKLFSTDPIGLRILFKLGRYQDVISDIDEKMNSSSTDRNWLRLCIAHDADLLFIKASAESATGQSKKAADDYRKAATDYMVKGDPARANLCIQQSNELENVSKSEIFGLGDLDFNFGREPHNRVGALLEFLAKDKNPLEIRNLNELTSAALEPPERHSPNWSFYQEAGFHLYPEFLGAEYSVKNNDPIRSASFRTNIIIQAVYFRRAEALALFGEPNKISDDEFHDVRYQDLEWKFPTGNLKLSFFRRGAESLNRIEFKGVAYDSPSHSKPILEGPISTYQKKVMTASQLNAPIKHLKHEITKRPKFAASYHNLCILYLGKNNLHEALKCVNKCIELDHGSDLHLYTDRAYVYERLGCVDKAIDDLSIVINSEKDKRESRAHRAYSLRGDLHLKNSDYQKAIEDYKASDDDNFWGATFEKIARAEYASGDKKSACEDMHHAIQQFYSEARVVRRDAAARQLSQMMSGEPFDAIRPPDEI